jgi:hypothetical protein
MSPCPECPRNPEVATKSWSLALLGAFAVTIVGCVWGLTDRAVSRAEAAPKALRAEFEDAERKHDTRFERIDRKLDKILLHLGGVQ